MSGVSNLTTIETDVLVIGGGVAGCLAALAARSSGADVLVCDKGGRLAWSGSVGGGVDQFLAVLETDEEWDQPAFLMESVGQLTDGLVDLPVVERMVYELPRVFRRIESTGVQFRERKGPPHINGIERSAFPALTTLISTARSLNRRSRAVRRAGAKELMRCSIIDVFDVDGVLAGAFGINIRTGALYAIRAKSCVLATGDVNRISRNISDMPFASWHCPYNTGDAQTMALSLGGVLANMEFIEATLGPTGFSSQGTNALTGLGAHYLNNLGERFMFKYDPLGERARRSVLVDAVINETLEGRAPIYLDVRHLPEHELANIERTLEVDRHTVPGFLRQKGVSLADEPIEISISEFSIRRSGVYFRGSGIVIDEDGQIGLAGAYAAGDCCTVSAGIAGASSLGWIAGVNAALWAVGIEHSPEIPVERLAACRDAFESHLQSNSEGSYWDFEDRIREVVTWHVGFRRTAEGLSLARESLRVLGGEADRLHGADAHEVSRIFESKSILAMAEALALAAETRRETRSGSSHHRTDFPQSDEEWRKVLGIRKGNRGLETIVGPAEGPWRQLWNVPPSLEDPVTGVLT